MNKLFATLLTLVSFHSLAQSPVSERLRSGVDVGLAYSTNSYHPSIAYFQLINIGQRKLVALGWTARLGAFYGNNLDYYTAPARLTRQRTGFIAIGAPLVATNIDTVHYDHVSMTSLNLGVRAQVNLGRVEIGASADLVGLTIGKAHIGRYQSSTGQFMLTDSTRAYFQGVNSLQRSKPTHLNARLLGDNNIGTLATEVYIRIHISQRIGAKIGYQWLITETAISNRDIVADNNRFRNRIDMPYVALTFPIF